MADRPLSRSRSSASARLPAVSACGRRFIDGGGEFVDEAWCQERRETGCEAEEEKLVGMVPTHVQVPRNSPRQRAVKDRQLLTPQRDSPNWRRPEELRRAAGPLLVAGTPVRGLVALCQIFVWRRQPTPCAPDRRVSPRPLQSIANFARCCAAFVRAIADREYYKTAPRSEPDFSDFQ